MQAMTDVRGRTSSIENGTFVWQKGLVMWQSLLAGGILPLSFCPAKAANRNLDCWLTRPLPSFIHAALACWHLVLPERTCRHLFLANPNL
jgi:hypothetical protein